VKRAHESEKEFRTRINVAARDADEQTTTSSGNDPNWLLGIRNRHKGSLHSDIWKGTAAELASRGVIAVYPVSGWWKTRPKLERFDETVQYSLIVSIHVPEVDVELYSAIGNMLVTQVEV